MNNEQDLRERYVAERLAREVRLRLFQQLHQGPESEDADRYGLFLRSASGDVRCEYCGLEYRLHPYDMQGPVDDDGRHINHRLCGGETAHL